MTSTLSVENVPANVTETELRELFGQAGDVVKVKVQGEGTWLGKYAIVEMADEPAARRAIQLLDGYELSGETISVGEIEPGGRRRGAPSPLPGDPPQGAKWQRYMCGDENEQHGAPTAKREEPSRDHEVNSGETKREQGRE